VKVIGVANRSRESAERFGREFGVERVYEDWHGLVGDPGIDIVWIGTWPYLHAEVTEAALDAGKHVFCQARMASNLAEARRMVKANRYHPDLVTMVCPPPHGMPGDTVVRELLHGDRYCGAVLQVRLTALNGAWLDEKAPMSWRKDERLSGINIATLVISVEVMHRWLGYHSCVTAEFDTHVPRRLDPTTGEVRDVVIPDAVRIIARYESGAGAIYHVSGLCLHAPDETLEIHGTEGTIVYNFGKDQILAGRGDPPRLSEVVLGARRREWTVERDFIEAVRTGDRSRIEPTFEEGLKYMEFLEAVWLSYKRRAEVRLIVSG
jgi:predicted dehydrogenase